MRRHILTVGNDARLLYTRRLVLEHAGVVVHVAPPGGAIAALRHTPFDLLVLCHTLGEDEVDTLLAAVEASHPHVKALLLGASSGPANGLEGRERFELREGPAGLVRRVRELLSCNLSEEEWSQASPPTPALRLVPRPVSAPSLRLSSVRSGGGLSAQDQG